MKFLCIIIDRATNKSLAEYEVDAVDWYYARHIAADKYREINGYNNWYVDSLEI